MWDILHSSAFIADANGVSLDPLVKPLTQILPCSYCRDSFNLFYTDLGAPATGLAAAWIYEAHKLVTQKLSQQRLGAFVKARATEWPAAAIESFKANGHSLISEPTFEVVQKRFMVNRDEPILWRHLSTVLLAMVMGIEAAGAAAGSATSSSATGSLDAQYDALVAFLTALRPILALSHQCTASDIQDTVDNLVNKLKKGPLKAGPADMRLYIEDLKYGQICTKSRRNPKDYSRLIKAGACINGSCQ